MEILLTIFPGSPCDPGTPSPPEGPGSPRKPYCTHYNFFKHVASPNILPSSHSKHPPTDSLTIYSHNL